MTLRSAHTLGCVLPVIFTNEMSPPSIDRSEAWNIFNHEDMQVILVSLAPISKSVPEDFDLIFEI